MFKSLILCLILIKFSIQQEQNKIESELIKSLLSNYTKLMRPSDSVSVEVGIQLIQIISVDEKNQILTTLSYLHMKWNDIRLSWNYNDNNVKSVTIKANNIWIPDLMVTNSADSSDFFNLNDNFMVTVANTGQITLYLKLTGLKTRCDINIKSVS